MQEIATLSAEDVLQIHEILVADFARTADPIAPPGVRDLGLLESAVGRQTVGSGNQLKYSTPVQVAATLFYGVCNNHAFHNGNKRTALVTLLVHLDRNGLTLRDTNQKDLFRMTLAVATHSFTKKGSGGTATPDTEVRAIATWLQQRTSKLHRGERQITFRELRRLLHRRGFELVPSTNRGNSADIYHCVEVKRPFRGVRKERKRIGTIGYRDDGTMVSCKDLKDARRICGLTAESGIDSDAFYDAESVLDAFINKYRGVLGKLAHR